MRHLFLVTCFPGIGSLLSHFCLGYLFFIPFLLEALLILRLSDLSIDDVPDFLLFSHIAGWEVGAVGVVGLFVLRSSRVSISFSGVTTEIYLPYLPCPRYISISSHFGCKLASLSFQVWFTIVQNNLLVLTKTCLKYMLLKQ